MRFNSFLVRDIALIFFAAVGICKAAGDLLALVFVEPSDNDYVQALILTVVMLAWKYFNKEKKTSMPKVETQNSNMEKPGIGN